MTSHRKVCIHGHFYQPPRENPFTGNVEDQPSARPFANWNERITAESYIPNLHAQVLDPNGNEIGRVNNYASISHDFGPTLLTWLEENHPETYAGVIEADRLSMEKFGGHGSAMAQSYNHTILPLSTRADKRTQIVWGVADFKHRYGRHPRGLWLPETAVDNETLEILHDNGIEFTVLSPFQASRAEDDSGSIVDVSGGRVDPRYPYYVEAASGKTIAVLFYDGPVSKDIAFNGLLDDGHRLAARLVGTLGTETKGVVLGHVATDGETYGHHHRFGEMALAAAIRDFESNPDVALTNYSLFLAQHPPQRRAMIAENSSWSCSHGIERWRSDCGCSTGGEPGWNQRWREPLRQALDWLRDELVSSFQTIGSDLLQNPWEARDSFIEVLLGRDRVDFLHEHCTEGASTADQERALGLLEIQRRSMMMYTSCGWFFNDLSGLETVFVLRHAGRAMELERTVSGVDLQPGFLKRLELAESNHVHMNGSDVYLAEVAPFLRNEDVS